MEKSNPNQEIGAWLDLEVGNRLYSREITVGGGHAGGTSGPEHFGLGSGETARLRVTWPDGTVSDWVEIEADCLVRVTRVQNGLSLERL